jgi:trans-2,3-dihydro-3-hydroxyanthranilate isomerase
VSTGNAFIIVPVKSLAAMQRLIFNQAEAKRYLEKHSGKFLYWISSECSNPDAQFHARMIFYNGEDPATGSRTWVGRRTAPIPPSGSLGTGDPGESGTHRPRRRHELQIAQRCHRNAG